MDPHLLNHLLQLAARTGDRLIVVDAESRQPFVLMGLPQYERLLASQGVPATTASVGDAMMPVGGAPMAVPGTSAPFVHEGVDLGALAREQERIQANTASVTGFTSEPLHPVPLEEDRFYVEPLE